MIVFITGVKWGGLGRENWSHRFSAIDSRRKFGCLDEQHGPNRLTTFRFFVCVFEMRFFFSNISRVLFFLTDYLPASLYEETNNMPYSQWNRQPDKADLFS